MNHEQGLSRVFKIIGLALTLGVSMSAFATGTFAWKEEVLLHDGSKIVVERSITHGGHGIAQGGLVTDESLTFTIPGTSQNIIWTDQFSEDVGHSNFELLALHILNGAAYITSSAYGCLSYNKWGRPNPPYIFFKYDGKAWQRIPLAEFPLVFKEINLVINNSAHEKKLVAEDRKSGFVSVASIKEFNSSLKQPEYKTIMREPAKFGTEGSSVNCLELVLYKGKWIMPNDPVMRAILDRKTN